MGFHSSDSRIVFDGFISVYKPSSEEENSTWSVGHGDVLSALKEGDPVSLEDVHPNQHFTKPPPRYSEATLVKALEEKGIGRPSTYSSILRILKVGFYGQCCFFDPSSLKYKIKQRHA